jgi:hypothetical protein|tara:strand:- start:609 stop:911 length:303 start_codon:yes stop_codon:yes gene_type:complete
VRRGLHSYAVAADGTVGATLVAWDNYGTQSGDYYDPSDYTPTTIAVQTPHVTATHFKVSVRHTYASPYIQSRTWFAGLAIFRVNGAAAPGVALSKLRIQY